jgi:hypothetical protein
VKNKADLGSQANALNARLFPPVFNPGQNGQADPELLEYSLTGTCFPGGKRM